MANRTFQVVMQAESNLPRDAAVNILHFDTESDTVVADGLAAAYTALAGRLNSAYGGAAGLLIKWYGPNGGQPLGQKEYAWDANGGQGPTEVALCLSYATVDDPEASTPRRRGRIYLPWGDTAKQRPSTTDRDAILDFGEALAQIGTANGTTWMMRSATDASFVKIESVWTDDAWDTQRRRGLAPTLREVRDVQ